jgi:16S rRNA (adenine1518-N6/adenine1519-N6)-dimethyltransferase
MPELGLLDPASIRRLAAELDLRPTKQRGQNFVHDPNTVRRIVALSGVTPDDQVLEIGPGLGSLTLGLLETGASVTAIEIEDSLAQRLPRTVAQRLGDEAASRLHVVHADAMEVSELPGRPPTAVVANLPYNVSVPVLLRLLELFDDWDRGLVMVQLEVADRLVAAPGSKVYGVPSAKMAWYAEAVRVGTVGPAVFWPVPNVDSGLVRITRRPPPEGDRAATFAVIDAAFAQRRKMLRSALSKLFGSSAAASAALEAAGVSPEARGETLTVEAFARVAAQRSQEVGA